MNLVAIHDLLIQHFSAEELRTLCFSLGIEYDDLPGSGRTDKARELVAYCQRHSRLPDLQKAVTQARPNVTWPTDAAPTNPPNPTTPTRWQLAPNDFNQLASLLATLPEFRATDRRIDFLDDVFAGSSRQHDILGRLNLDGQARGVAVRVINTLMSFGQDEPGQETLGVLLNKLLNYIGGGSEADFIRGLFERYPLTGTPVSTRGLTDWSGRDTPKAVQEKVIGENTLRHVRLLELALEASQAVVRIRTASGMGSGFVVGLRLVMTNNHVISSRNEVAGSQIDFNYQLDRLMEPAPLFTTTGQGEGHFYTNPHLDVTVFEITAIPEGLQPLALARKRVQRDDRVNIIQHPGGHYKKISMQNNFVAFANVQDLQYLTTTEPGSSGSPVFNNDFVVVGIHHSGGNLPEPGSNQIYLRNAGSSMIAVLDALQAEAAPIYEQLRVQ